ncbi:hypothetical protein [Rhizobium sp. RU36D]|uniref:hypothetical protein n=1 Tax=Rhizobium sp. RU36D TaxID=1907415 RepID=UPI0009D89C96|nr:hypothetical protein [Rhizobium sp. RU36D]SMD17877.1 hypothetical protein SAMN05880593_13342 [Rhizobium sp. RU36D]
MTSQEDMSNKARNTLTGTLIAEAEKDAALRAALPRPLAEELSDAALDQASGGVGVSDNLTSLLSVLNGSGERTKW